MTSSGIEVVRGSGNVYRDLDRPNPDLQQARALIAAKIIKILTTKKYSNKDAETASGIAHSEFSRIRNSQLRRFTLDRLIFILGKLDETVEVQIAVKRRRKAA
ncbi:MAG: helix-turn-helix domain-containing protein [Beijerinckiaceae bacterium]